METQIFNVMETPSPDNGRAAGSSDSLLSPTTPLKVEVLREQFQHPHPGKPQHEAPSETCTEAPPVPAQDKTAGAEDVAVPVAAAAATIEPQALLLS